MTEFEFRDRLPEEIMSDRLVLRALGLQDVETMTRLANSKRIYAMLSRLPHPYKREHAVNFIENVARCDTEHAYAVTSRDDVFIGTIGLHLVPGEAAEIGYWLGQAYWGEGFGSEAALALVDAAQRAGCTKIKARAKTANRASIRVLEKAGFIVLGNGIDDCGVHKGVDVTQLRWEADR